MADKSIIIVLSTSRSCPHCITFRHNDGKPEINFSDSKKYGWTLGYINYLLQGGDSGLKVDSIYELHYQDMFPKNERLISVSCYLLTKDNKIARMIFERLKGNNIQYRLEINGISNNSEKEKFEEEVMRGINIPQVYTLLFEKSEKYKKNGKITKLTVEEKKKLSDEDIKVYENLLATTPDMIELYKNITDTIYNRYLNFGNIIADYVPKDCETYPKYMPCWSFYTVEEWHRGLVGKGLFGYASGLKTIRNADGGFSTIMDKPISSIKPPHEILAEISKNKINLERTNFVPDKNSEKLTKVGFNSIRSVTFDKKESPNSVKSDQETVLDLD